MANTFLWRAMVAVILIAGHALQLRAANLSQQLDNTVVQQVFPAYRSGNRTVVWKAVTAMISKLKLSDASLLDDALARHKLPSAAAILTEIRLTSGPWRGSLPKASRREVLLILEHANRTIDEVLENSEKQLVMEEDRVPPSTYEDFETIVWAAHVYRNELENAANLSIAAGKLQQQFKQALSKVEEYEPKDYQQVLASLFGVRVELHERDLELKLERIAYSHDVLEGVEPVGAASSPEDAAKAKLLAAYSFQKDGQAVLDAFAKADKGTTFKFATQLNSELIRGDLQQQIEAGRKLAGDSLSSSEHLFDGLHWWFRGRYGRGTHNGGLLKPKNAATNQQAQMALMMPKKPPVPKDPVRFTKQIAASLMASKWQPSADSYDSAYDDGYVRDPEYDRRHHYIWSQEPPMFLTQNVGLYFH